MQEEPDYPCGARTADPPQPAGPRSAACDGEKRQRESGGDDEFRRPHEDPASTQSVAKRHQAQAAQPDLVCPSPTLHSPTCLPKSAPTHWPARRTPKEGVRSGRSGRSCSESPLLLLTGCILLLLLCPAQGPAYRQTLPVSVQPVSSRDGSAPTMFRLRCRWQSKRHAERNTAFTKVGKWRFSSEYDDFGPWPTSTEALKHSVEFRNLVEFGYTQRPKGLPLFISKPTGDHAADAAAADNDRKAA
eukprot:COSAG01_NODE_799_length_13501_cov_15.980749_3_plen_245_part_00